MPSTALKDAARHPLEASPEKVAHHEAGVESPFAGGLAEGVEEDEEDELELGSTSDSDLGLDDGDAEPMGGAAVLGGGVGAAPGRSGTGDGVSTVGSAYSIQY